MPACTEQVPICTNLGAADTMHMPIIMDWMRIYITYRSISSMPMDYASCTLAYVHIHALFICALEKAYARRPTAHMGNLILRTGLPSPAPHTGSAAAASEASHIG